MRLLINLVTKINLRFSIVYFLIIGLSQDTLLHGRTSDWVSVLGLHLGVLFLLCLISIGSAVLVFIRTKFHTKKLEWDQFATALLISTIAFLTWEMIVNPFKSIFVLIVSFIFILILLLKILSLDNLKNNSFIKAAMTFLGITALIINMGGFPSYKIYQFFNPSVIGDGRPNVVLIVADYLGNQHLKEMADLNDSITPNLDEFSKNSMTFNNYHTSGTDAAIFFSTLYSGEFATRKRESRKNLVHRLHGGGVYTKIIASHITSLPDSTKQVYKGIRSAYLTQYFTFLPKLLGLHYHIYRWRPNIGDGRRHFMDKRSSDLVNLLNQWMYEDPFKTLIKEMKLLDRKKEPYFAMLHLFVSDFDPRYVHEGRQRKRDKEKIDYFPEIKRNQWRYLPKHQGWVEEEKLEYMNSVRRLDASFGKFWEFVKSKKWDENTIYIVTAGYGFSFEDGEYGYKRHASESVTWVPLIVYKKDWQGIDERGVDTLDLHSTILDAYNLNEVAAKSGISLFSDRSKEMTFTFGYLGNSGQLIAYHNKDKYYFAINPIDLNTQFIRAVKLDGTGDEYRIESPDQNIVKLFNNKRV